MTARFQTSGLLNVAKFFNARIKESLGAITKAAHKTDKVKLVSRVSFAFPLIGLVQIAAVSMVVMMSSPQKYNTAATRCGISLSIGNTPTKDPESEVATPMAVAIHPRRVPIHLPISSKMGTNRTPAETTLRLKIHAPEDIFPQPSSETKWFNGEYCAAFELL